MKSLNEYKDQLLLESSQVKGFDYKNNEMLKDPLYQMINNWKLYKLEHISPKEYLEKIAKGFGISYKDTINSPHVNQDTVDKYAEDMKTSKFPIGFYTVGKSAQEGRHRALAALKLGLKKIPVIRIEDIEDRDQIVDFVSSYRNASKKDLEKATKEFWPNGLSNLDWNEFQRYIEYQLD